MGPEELNAAPHAVQYPITNESVNGPLETPPSRWTPAFRWKRMPAQYSRRAVSATARSGCPLALTASTMARGNTSGSIAWDGLSRPRGQPMAEAADMTSR